MIVLSDALQKATILSFYFIFLRHGRRITFCLRNTEDDAKLARMQSGTGGVLPTRGHSEYGKSMTTSTSTQDEYAPVSLDIYAKVEKKGGQHDTCVHEIGKKAGDMTVEVYEAMSSRMKLSRKVQSKIRLMIMSL